MKIFRIFKKYFVVQYNLITFARFLPICEIFRNYSLRNLQLINKIAMEPKTYTYQQAYEASLKYFDGDELAARVWSSKYALKDSFGHLYELTPDDMHRHIARQINRTAPK